MFVMFASASAKVTGVKQLKWIDPYRRQPIKYNTWKAEHIMQDAPTRITTVYKKSNQRGNVVDVVVNSGIYPDIAAQLDTFTNDLVSAGYSVQLDTISGMSHTTLRSHLAGISNIAGAIFVGEVPVAWFETNGFGEWEEYPHDLYFSDLDGTYVDSDNDGIYDDHTGSVAPEIWVGRIYARNLTWDNEIRLLKDYFHKDHQYRVNGSPVPERALSFVDDDWSYWGNCYLNLVYSNVVVENNDQQTTANEYRSQLTQGYEWVHICAHSSPWGHTFKDGSGGYKGSVFNYEIFTLVPHALFYNLFACSGTRFVEENYSAGWYIFVDPYGLIAVGSTKTGSMLYFDDFYGPLGQQNMCIGDAFKSWFTTWGESDWDWFYGMDILGDPTLKPKSQMALQHHNILSKTAKEVKNLNSSPANFPSIDWSGAEVVSPNFESDAFPKIVTNTDGKVWCVWESGRSPTNGRSEIYSSYRSGGGWSNAMVVGPIYYWDYCPDIGIDNQNRPVAVWAGWPEGSYQYDLFYSVYNGSWSARQPIYQLDPAFDLKPTLIKDNDTGLLWLSWESRRDVSLNIYACHFDGSNWSSPEAVTQNSADETTPQMVIDSTGNIWVFYARKNANVSEIWGSYYNGSIWVESGPISGTQKRAYRPSAAVDGNGKIWVSWQATGDGNSDIYLSSYNGSIWSSPIKLTSNPESDLFPDMAAQHNGAVWLVYQSKVAGDWDVYYSYCTDSTWSTPEPVLNISGADINPQITVSSDDEIWVVWQSYSTGNWEVMVTHTQGVGVIEGKKVLQKSHFGVSSTLFSKDLKITTNRPDQVVDIYDIKGALIRSLQSNGDNIVLWSPGNIPNGIYFVTLSDGSVHFSKKVVFIR